MPLFDSVTNESQADACAAGACVNAGTTVGAGASSGVAGAPDGAGASGAAGGTCTASASSGALPAALRLDAAENLLREARVRATEATARALAAVGGLPVVVDTRASLRPFSLALALIKVGFNVAAVFALHSKGNDTEAEEELTREHPEIVVVRKQGLEAMAELGIPRACVALGRDAAFLLRADHSPNMYHDEGLFGYEGIEKLMDSITACMEHTERWDA